MSEFDRQMREVWKIVEGEKMGTKKHLDMLGMKVVDRVTGMRGVVSSISFDLYGCIQAIVVPPVDDDGKLPGGKWFDVARLKVTGKKRVMDVPDFEGVIPVSEGRKGPADKP